MDSNNQMHSYLYSGHAAKLFRVPNIFQKPNELYLRWMVIGDLFGKFDTSVAEGPDMDRLRIIAGQKLEN